MTMIIDGTNGLTFNNSTVQASAGVVLQVVQGSTSTSVSNATTSYVDTGLTATITPKFATSKILVIVNQAGLVKNNGDVNLGINLNLLRNSTNICHFGEAIGFTGTAITLYCGNASTAFLDSPATTSATTYKTQFSNNAAASTVFVQVSSQPLSTITLMEIAA